MRSREHYCKFCAKEHIRKRCIALFVSVVLLFAAIWRPECITAEEAQITSGATPDGFVYSTYDGEVSIRGYVGTSTEIVIPDTIEGYPVTTIAPSAFMGYSWLTSVEIPPSIKSIASAAFDSCSGLINIKIPSSVTYIGFGAFGACKGLTSIELPSSITEIESSVFSGCSSLTSIEIPVSVTRIGNSAFRDCSGLTSIEIPTGVTSIGDSAFSGCSGLTSIEIPASVTSIGTSVFGAFEGCGGLSSIRVSEGNTVYDSRENCNAIIQTSSNELLLGCKETQIPMSVTSIRNNAFKDCSGLTSIEIPSGVISIGEEAFNGCSGLSSIRVSENNTVYDSRENCNAIIKTSSNELLAGCKETKIPTSVTSIGRGAFKGCSGLISIKIPLGATSIGNGAFKGCSGLTSIEIPTSVTGIGNSAFEGCSSLISIEIPTSVTSIGDSAFRGCSSLTSIEIPTSVMSIGYYAFNNCSGLNSIQVSEGNTVYDSRENCNAIIKTSSNELLAGCKETKIPTSVTSIGRSAFSGCRGLTSIEIPTSVTGIGDSAFNGCSGLTSIEIPTSVTGIGNSVFSGCSGLTSIEIPTSVTSIGNSAFSGCSGLTSIEIPTSVTSIGNSAFNGCSGLVSIEIPSSVKSIGEHVIFGCKSLVRVTNYYSYAIKLPRFDNIPWYLDGTDTMVPWNFDVNGATPAEIYLFKGQTAIKRTDTADSGEIVDIPNEYSDVFSASYYYNNYSDAAKVCGKDAAKLLEHFVNYGMKEGRQGSEAFNPEIYKSNYKDLRDAFGDDWKSYYEHYIQEGKSQGRNAVTEITQDEPEKPEEGEIVDIPNEYSDVFSASYYYNNYRDVAAAFGKDAGRLLEHFVNYGMEEGRQGSEAFNPEIYKSNYKDLRNAFGDDWKRYYEHYIHDGKHEGRNAVTEIVQEEPEEDGIVDIPNEYSDVFSASYYYNNYQDVAAAFGKDAGRLLEHFVNYGMEEGRQGSEAFNPEIYKSNYKDLRNAFGDGWKRYYEHYIHDGKHEGRNAVTKIVQEEPEEDGIVDIPNEYSDVFSASYYYNNYQDVAAAFGKDAGRLLEHFVNYGMEEGRQGSRAFNPKVYKSNYKDLQDAFGDGWKRYYEHYIHDGKREGRNAVTEIVQEKPGVVEGAVSDVFDASYYRDNNPDVAGSEYGVSAEKLLEHFVTYGMQEGRQGCENFNPKVYKENNGDLQAAFGNDWAKYYRHYIDYGKYETHRVTK